MLGFFHFSDSGIFFAVIVWEKKIFISFIIYQTMIIINNWIVDFLECVFVPINSLAFRMIMAFLKFSFSFLFHLIQLSFIWHSNDYIIIIVIIIITNNSWIENKNWMNPFILIVEAVFFPSYFFQMFFIFFIILKIFMYIWVN